VSIMNIKEWVHERKLKKQLSKMRSIEIAEVNSYMEGVFNPIRVTSKPKYRQKTKQLPEEKEIIRMRLHQMYNPPITPNHRKDHTLNEYFKGEI
jgi:uncharacterized protein (DUF342 family)